METDSGLAGLVVLLRAYGVAANARKHRKLRTYHRISMGFMGKISAIYAVENEKQKKMDAAYQETMKRILPGYQP